MGIQGLTKLLAEKAPKALVNNGIESYFGRKVAIDASMSIYQFLIAVRQPNGELLVNGNGDVTSHIMGLFYRTVRMVDNGLKPCYVFDGKPPTLKSGELAKRKERREKAEQDLEKAQEAGEAEQVVSFTKRLVKVTKEHNDDCKRLLKLMGIPFVEAPCEAEAQCAALCKAGKVYASGSEDMDTLTFDSPKLLRHLTYSESKKVPIAEFDVSKVLEGLQLTMDQFIDLCILLGCDYCDSIKGIGPVKAYQLIKQHKDMETIIKNLDKKYTVPENFDYVQARQLFKQPEVLDPNTIDLKWNQPDTEGLIEFLVKGMGFDDKRVLSGIDKLKKNLAKGQQSRIEDFFKKSGTSSSSTPTKRKTETQGKGKNDKGKKKSTGRPPTR